MIFPMTDRIKKNSWTPLRKAIARMSTPQMPEFRISSFKQNFHMIQLSQQLIFDWSINYRIIEAIIHHRALHDGVSVCSCMFGV